MLRYSQSYYNYNFFPSYFVFWEFSMKPGWS
jgi:hypothetical protein